MASSLARNSVFKINSKNALRDSLQKLAASSLSSVEHSYPEPILRAPETNITRLSNGVRVASESRGGELASLSIAIEAGSRLESESSNGTTSLIKTLAYSGQLKEIAALGGMFGAEAGRESIRFNATVHAKDVKKAMEILSKAATVANCTPDSVGYAKGKVLCEIEGARLRPEEYLMDHLHDAAFLGSSMGLPLLGTPTSVNSISESNISDFVSRHFIGSRFVVAAAGAVDHATIAETAESFLGSVSPPKVGEIDSPMEECPFIGSDKRIRYDNKPLAHIALAFKGASSGSEYALPLQLITSIMGKWDRRAGLDIDTASRWHLALAEHDIANQAEVYSIGYKDTGIMGFTGVSKDISLDNFMWFSLESMVRMCHKVTDEEVLRGKIALKTKLMLETSLPQGACSEISNQVMNFGRRIHPAELFARIDAISTADVRATAFRFIHDQDHALSAVGPIYELPDYNWIRRRSYWLRY